MRYRVWVCIVLLAACGVGLAARSRKSNQPLSQPLRTLPLEIAGWKGTEAELDPRVVAAVNVDEYVNRYYQRSDGQILSLYVGYYRGQQTGDAIHSPKNCLPGAGWQPHWAGTTPITLPDGSKAQVNFYLVHKGKSEQVVLYWYQSQGRVVASEYWAKFYMVWNAIRNNRTDGALVRVVLPSADDPGKQRDIAVRFVEAMQPDLEQIVPR